MSTFLTIPLELRSQIYTFATAMNSEIDVCKGSCRKQIRFLPQDSRLPTTCPQPAVSNPMFPLLMTCRHINIELQPVHLRIPLLRFCSCYHAELYVQKILNGRTTHLSVIEVVQKARKVVIFGFHVRRWTKEEQLQWLVTNTRDKFEASKAVTASIQDDLLTIRILFK